MIDSLKKSLRTLRRDYFDPNGLGTMMGSTFGLVGCLAGIMSIFIPAGPPALLCFAGALLCCLAGAGSTALAKRSDALKREDAWVKNEKGFQTHIVGPGLKVTTLVNTQEIVEHLTRDLARSATLPPEVQKKLEPWLKDAAEAAKEVQGWDISGTPVTTISFLRSAFNAQGKKVTIPVATYNLFDPNGAQPAAAAAAPATVSAPAAPGVIVVSKPITLKGQPTP